MSPMRSEAQRRKLWAMDPEMAERWEKETPPGKLPERVRREEPERKPRRHPPRPPRRRRR